MKFFAKSLFILPFLERNREAWRKTDEICQFWFLTDATEIREVTGLQAPGPGKH